MCSYQLHSVQIFFRDLPIEFSTAMVYGLSIYKKFVHNEKGTLTPPSVASVWGTASTGYRRSFFLPGKLVIETKFGPFNLPSPAFDQLLLLVVFKFCDDRLGILGSLKADCTISLIDPSGLQDASSGITRKY